ncbi:MAG: hypothetical protein LBR17_01780 [Bacteroidales bacterium]|jgi:hypothetical protein|nr:hypothetical protein [Bacteroidales bacterium]
MSTLTEIQKMLSKFTLNGSFETNRKTTLKTIPSELDNYGVYFFTEKDNDDEKIVYIGKSGTMNQNGEFGKQTLRKRIMKGKKKKEWLSKNNYKVYWYVTSENKCSKCSENIPAVVECSLLKKYYELNKGKLPKYNNAF